MRSYHTRYKKVRHLKFYKKYCKRNRTQVVAYLLAKHQVLFDNPKPYFILVMITPIR